MFEESTAGRGKLSGRLDMNGSAALLPLLCNRVAQSALQLDLSGISEADSSAVALLLACQRTADQAGHVLQLTGWPQNLQALVELYALGELLCGPQGE